MSQDSQASTESSAIETPREDGASILSLRSRRQLGIYAAGSAFMLLSAAITRRAIIRRNNWTRPLFFHPSNQPPITPINGPLEALEALSVATVNVFSFGIMFTGGIFWAFDIASLDELRERTRARLGYEEAIAAERGSEEATQELASIFTEERGIDDQAKR